MKNRRIYGMWGRNLGVRVENWPEYPQVVIYRSPKIVHESYVTFGKKNCKNPRWPPADIKKKKKNFN